MRTEVRRKKTEATRGGINGRDEKNKVMHVVTEIYLL